MLMTEREPASLGEILGEEFMEPLGLSSAMLADAMGMPPEEVAGLCAGRRALTATTALILARVFGNTPDFWLNVQRRNDLWAALNAPEERERIARAKPLRSAA